MMIKTGKHIDANGKIYLPYLHEWKHVSVSIFLIIDYLFRQGLAMKCFEFENIDCSCTDAIEVFEDSLHYLHFLNLYNVALTYENLYSSCFPVDHLK